MIHDNNFQHLPNRTLSQLSPIYDFVKYIKFVMFNFILTLCLINIKSILNSQVFPNSILSLYSFSILFILCQLISYFLKYRFTDYVNLKHFITYIICSFALLLIAFINIYFLISCVLNVSEDQNYKPLKMFNIF